MKISICIPQYNRWKYLVICLDSIRRQTYRDIEVVVSDDGSTDASPIEIPAYLEKSGLTYKYVQQPVNLGYDKNLRAAMHAATGDYLFLIGNDDQIAAPDTIERLVEELEQHGRPEVVLGNTVDFGDDTPKTKRAAQTVLVPGDPRAAADLFRSFVCVMGLVVRRDAFLEHDTDAYDNSVFVQVFLGTRIMAAGGNLLFLDLPLVRVGSHVEGKHSNSYLDTMASTPWTFQPLTGGLDQVGKVTYEAVAPYLSVDEAEEVLREIFGRILSTSYVAWLCDYRSHGFGRFALSLARGCWPPRLLQGVPASRSAQLSLVPVYLSRTLGGLLVPVPILTRLKRWAARRVSGQQLRRVKKAAASG